VSILIGSDDSERKVLADIAHYGWLVLNILEEGDNPTWTFTIGLHKAWQHPEFIIVGLKKDVAYAILKTLVDAIKGKRPIDLKLPTNELLHNGACCFVEVSRQHYAEYVGFARWYYEGNNFPLYQVVWPSKENQFPWNTQATDGYKQRQSVLGDTPTA
jgi:hypothetical protein